MHAVHAARQQFAYYQHLGTEALERLTGAQLQWSPSPESNAVATIVKHLHGNMLSRWTDVLTADGEKPWRDREGEFSPDDASREEVMRRWREGWTAVSAALDAIEAAGVDPDAHIVYIRAKGHTVTEAIQRQLCHYAYHVGQIVLLSRLLVGADWKSLSIPRGDSTAYNAASFASGQRREHFTEEFLRK